MLNKFLENYSRRYIRTGSGTPVFHAMFTIFGVGILVHAKQHRDHHNDPKAVGH